MGITNADINKDNILDFVITENVTGGTKITAPGK